MLELSHEILLPKNAALIEPVLLQLAPPLLLTTELIVFDVVCTIAIQVDVPNTQDIPFMRPYVFVGMEVAVQVAPPFVE